MKSNLLLIPCLLVALLFSCKKDASTNNKEETPELEDKDFYTGDPNENKDVYVAGTNYILGDPFNASASAILWKNGVKQATGVSDATSTNGASVFVSNNDVYIAGTELTGQTFDGTKNYAAIWKNGVAQRLTEASRDAVATSVLVSGNDLYVVGYFNDGSNRMAMLWKNGIAQKLPTGNYIGGFANKIYIAQNDIYIAGSVYTQDKNQAVLWKNGVLQVLLDNLSSGGNAHDIFVKGDDVYVAGRAFYNNRIGVAVLWKNGIPQKLTPETETRSVNPPVNSKISLSEAPRRNAAANAVYVAGNDVYVAGWEFPNDGKFARAVIWKNGVKKELTNGITYAQVNDIYVSEGGNIYVAGIESHSSNYKAVLWKNGKPQYLSDGSTYTIANSLFVK